MKKKPGDEIIGKKVRVKKCENNIHGGGPACVCDLIGRVVTISNKWELSNITPVYLVKGTSKRVLRREVVLLRKQD